MIHYKRLLFSFILSLLLIIGGWQMLAANRPASAPSTIQVNVYRLDDEHGNNIYMTGDTPYPCSNSLNHNKWGCTAFDDNQTLLQDNRTPVTVIAYPYGSTLAPNLSFENDYLANVVPQEIIAGVPLAAVEAQAISARTYGMYHAFRVTATPGAQIDNSVNFQGFIPYRFEYLLAEGGDDAHNPETTPSPNLDNCNNFAATGVTRYQRKVCDALNGLLFLPSRTTPIALRGLYMANFGDSEPINAQFRTDNGPVTNPTPCTSYLQSYLSSVQDPISESGPTPGCSSVGLSTNGAQRWAFGNEDPIGVGTAWNVRWDRALNILVHYYTGVDLLDSTDTPLLAELRWNLLQQDDLVINAELDDMVDVLNIQVQNTGITAWTTEWIENNFAAIFYQYCTGTCTEPDPDLWQEGASVPELDPGSSSVVEAWVWPNPTPGSYTLFWDICRRAIWRANDEIGKPRNPEAIQGQTTWCANDVTNPGWYAQQVQVSNTPYPTSTP